MRRSTEASWLDRTLRAFTEVRPGEGVTAVLLALNVCLIFAAYYMIKPLRDGLVLEEYSAEVKSYLQVVNVAILAVVVPLYGKLADRLPRRRLINVVTYAFMALLGVFFLLGRADVPLGIPFFVYGSIFAVMIVAQFWSFANDLYTREEGERLFPIVGFGATFGAALGATFVGRLIEPYGIFIPMLLAAAVLFVELQITNYIDRREREEKEAGLPDVKTTATIAATGTFERPRTLEELEEAAERERELYEARERGEDPEAEKATGKSAFALVWATPYLMLICALVLLLNWVNSNGEYILGRVIVNAAAEAITTGDAGGLTEGEFISNFYANFYAVVNITALLIQLFLVSRIIKFAGVHVAVLALPMIALGAYGLIAFAPVVGVVRWAKTAENATDYSLNNTIRHALYLPTTREQKYKAKQVSDSFSHRAGDVLHAGSVFVGSSLLALSTTGFALFNLGVVAVWLFVAVAIGRRYQTLVASGRPPETRAGFDPAGEAAGAGA